MKHIAAMGAFALATLVAQARDITSLTLAQSGDDLTANVVFTVGETGDNHTLYLAYGPSDLGNTLYAWANGGGYVTHGAVSDSATGAVVTLPSVAKTAACYRAFLVKSTGVTPAYKTKLVECLRVDSSADSWFVTDYYCSGNESITAVFEGLGPSNRPFGSRSSDKSSIFEVLYSSSYPAWGYGYINSSGAVAWIQNTGLTASSGKTKIVMDTKNKKLTRISDAEGTDEKSINYTLITSGTEKSDYPLAIFANANSTDGKTVLNKVPADALLYNFSIKTNDSAYARYYIPCVSGTHAYNAYLWDAVGNTLLHNINSKGYSQSRLFVATDTNGNDFAELDFHAAVPAELQTKYETIVSSLPYSRQITALSIARNRETGRMTAGVSFTQGATGDDDILYIAWGDSDMGNTLAAWGTNVFCAGAVAADAQSASVTLPQGKYPCYFRAFLMKAGALDCDSFAEYLLSDGASFIKTDWYHTNGDSYSIKFSVEEIATGSRLMGNGYSSGKSLVEIYQWTNNAGVAYYRLSTDGASAQNWYSSLTTKLPAKLGLTLLAYDSGTGLLKVQYSDETSYQYTFTPGSSTVTLEGNAPVWLFASRRTQGNEMPSGSKFYSLSISNVVDSTATLARQYIPAVKDGTYGVWDAVQDKFIAPPSGHLFCTTNATGGAIGKLSFSAAVPEPLQRPYLVVTDTRLAFLPPTGMTIIIR